MSSCHLHFQKFAFLNYNINTDHFLIQPLEFRLVGSENHSLVASNSIRLTGNEEQAILYEKRNKRFKEEL